MSSKKSRRRNQLILMDVLEPRVLLAGDPVNLQRTTNALALGQTDVTTATVGDLTLFIGGSFYGGPGGEVGSFSAPYQSTDLVEIYNAATGQWSTSHLPQEEEGATAVTVGEEVVVSGGTVDETNTPVTAIQIYNSQTGVWSTTNSLLGVQLQAVGAIGNAAVLYDSDTGQVALYDVTTGTSSTHTLQTNNATAIVADGKAFFFENQGVVEIYDSATGSWSILDTGADNLFSGEAVAVDGKIVFGGMASSDGQVNGGVYDIASGQFTSSPYAAENDANIAVVGDTAIFAGGGPQFTPTNAVVLYDAATNQWTTATLSDSKHNILTFTLGNNAYFVGGIEDGYGDTSLTSDVYDNLTGTWTTYRLKNAIANNYGQPGPVPVVDGQVVFPFEYGTAYILTPSTLLPPSKPSVAPDAAVATSPKTLTWSSVPGAIDYDVYLDGQYLGNTSGNQWQLATAISQGHHNWQVVARDRSQFTAGPLWDFEVGPPTAPTNPSLRSGTALAQPPAQLSWASAAGATSYDVYLDGHVVLTTSGNYIKLSNAIAGGKHVWSVVAKNSVGKAASQVWTFYTSVSPVTKMSTPYPGNATSMQFSAVSVGGKVIFDENGAINNGDLLHVYDTGTEQWSTYQMPDALYVKNAYSSPPAPMVVDGQVIYSDGGTADVFNPSTGLLTDFGFPTYRPTAMTTAVVGNYAVFAGGEFQGKNYRTYSSNEVDVYDAATGQWSIKYLSASHEDMTTAVVDGKLLLAGGFYYGKHGEVPSDAVDIFDSATGTWASGTLSAARDSIVSAAAGDLAFFAGGTTNTDVVGQTNTKTYSNVVDIYDAATGQWSTANLSPARAVGWGVAVGADVLFAGANASDSDPTAQTTVDIYNVQFGSWTSVASPEQISGGSPVVLNGKAYFIGQVVNDGGTDLLIFDPSTGAFSSKALNGSGQLLAFGTKIYAGQQVYDPSTGALTNPPLTHIDDEYEAVADGSELMLLDQYDLSHSFLNRSLIDILGDAASIANLAGSVDQVTLSATPRIGDQGSALVTIRNQGSVDLNGPIHVSVEASTYVSPGEGSTPLGSVTVNEALAAGASIQVRIPLKTPASLSTSPQFIVASVQGSNRSTFSSPAFGTMIRLDTSRKPVARYG